MKSRERLKERQLIPRTWARALSAGGWGGSNTTRLRLRSWRRRRRGSHATVSAKHEAP